ncbi:importin alpha re-exporter [Wolfiporia cocos MD-104 SS10]|uniref:Importin alpha re-exporter n=1 Tax=Wolfiporia cocos (strain MD-104) TaxID=742152 RepID=A0A2H3ISP7_WOLCO|nr:importin alpha re-exporter [Wolfiporia cocos MD-104 SS10]
MAELPPLLLKSLNPAFRKQAENDLQALSVQSGFLSLLLRLVLDPSQDRAVRLAGSVYLKNVIKSRWEDEEPPILDADKAALRNELVPAMIALSNASDKAMRVQIAESISLIAKSDFPERWTDLIDKLVFSLSATDYDVNIGVLETAHSIFRPWRAATRSDKLFTVINLVLSRLTRPFMQLFLQTTSILFSRPPPPNLATVAQAQVLLVDIFYDFTCQDLPPDFEDGHLQFFGHDNGLFLQLLAWDPPELRGDPDDTTPSLPAQIKTGILETAELYVKLYPEILQNPESQDPEVLKRPEVMQNPDILLNSRIVEAFVRSVWEMVGSGKHTGIRDDGLVSQALRFMSTAIRSGQYKQLFKSHETISNLVQGIVVPNVGLREHEIEQFEDDPLEYIRLDLSVPSLGGAGLNVDAMTRRQAAAEVLRALVSSGFESETTQFAGAWIGEGLREYEKDRAQNWRAKDTAIYIMTAVATRGSTSQLGVTSTNTLVDVVQFFSDHVFQDLQAKAGTVHPILQVDAIRFLYTFRNQLVKSQLLSVLPLLVGHLNSDNYVCYTYAAISIERILFIRHGNQLLFNQADIHELAHPMVNALLSKIESAGSPQKVAENDYLMKCAMRVIITARSTLATDYERILQRLVGVLGVISSNPSNPLFDQYIFESISALMRFVVAANPDSLVTFEQNLFGPFTIILQQDIDQYVPYVFQVLAQMLESHKTGVPAEYRSLLPFLLTPAGWQQKGSIPGLVKLLKAFLARDAPNMIATSHYTAVLAIIQQRLIPSKLNDMWGFELLQSVVQYIPPPTLKQYFRPLMVTLLTRMQTSKTDKYVYHFVHFLAFTMAINVEGLGPDFVISSIEEIQPQLWSQIVSNFVVPEAPKMPPKDRKIFVVGITRLLTQSALMLQEPSVQVWPAIFTALAQLFLEPQYLTKKDGDDDPDAGLTAIDYEEQTAGYQAAYSRLAASETVSVDLVAHIRDPREYLGQELSKLTQRDPRVKTLISASDPEVAAPFTQSLASIGYGL